jgi:hypothetical protein
MNRRAKLLPSSPSRRACCCRDASRHPGGGCPESWAVPGTRACGRSARQIFMRKTPAGMYQCGPAMP